MTNFVSYSPTTLLNILCPYLGRSGSFSDFSFYISRTYKGGDYWLIPQITNSLPSHFVYKSSYKSFLKYTTTKTHNI